MKDTLEEAAASGAGKTAAQNAPLRRRRNLKLAAFHALPESLRDNEYITKYYRINYNGKQTIRSLFGLHNETGNIWTHFLGAPNIWLPWKLIEDSLMFGPVSTCI
jgi:hypothetical protein